MRKSVFGFELSLTSTNQNAKAISLISMEELQANITTNSSQAEKDIALKLACYADHFVAVQYLLSLGANPNTNQNIDSYYFEKLHLDIHDCMITPVFIANLVGSEAVLNELLTSGAIPEILSSDEMLTEKTHLIFCCSSPEKMACVMRHDTSWQTARMSGRPILHHLLDRNSLAKLHILLQHPIDLEEVDEEGNTPLMLAVSRATSAPGFDAVEVLLKRGVSLSLDTRNHRGENLFDLARAGLSQFLKNLVLNNPGKISQKQLQNKLFGASICQDVGLMQFLCGHGASMSAFRQAEPKALAMALRGLHGSLLEKAKPHIEYLLQNGFDENNLAPEDRDKLHKILKGQDPSKKEISKEELATRQLLETQLQQFMALPFSMSELAQQQKDGDIRADHRHLADLIKLIVRNEKCRPDTNLIAAANAQGLCVKIAAYEVQLLDNNNPVFGLFKDGILVSKLSLQIHYSGSHPMHLHNDSELWAELRAQIKPNAGATTVGSPNSSHMFKSVKASGINQGVGTDFRRSKL